MNLHRTISIMTAFLVILAGWSFGVLLEVGLGMLGFIGLTQISQELRGRKFFDSPYLALLLASVFLVSAGIGERRLQPELAKLSELENDLTNQVEKLHIDIEGKKKQIEWYKTERLRGDISVPRLQPSRLHSIVFAEAGIRRIRMLGVNSLGVLHKYRKDLGELLVGQHPIHLEVLLLDPRSPAFETRRDCEESGATIPNRMYKEWETALAILSDIASYSRQGNGPKKIKARLEIRIHAQKPKRSMLFVETKDEMFLIKNTYSGSCAEPGTAGGSRLVSLKKDPGDVEEWDNIFKDLWENATSISLDDLKAGMVSHGLAKDAVLSWFRAHSAEAKDARKVYEKALTLHRQRRLDEASELYMRVLEIEPFHDPDPQQLELARRFLPDVFVTPNEPFELKDLVVVLHPSEPLIAYHLVWQDDIDFLTDNDPGDHEIVWIRYNTDDRKTVERAWAYWHGKFPCSEAALDRANGADARIKVSVQWGKHGSLLDGWEDVIDVNGDPSAEELEPLQYSRLQGKGRYQNDTFYAKKWPVKFEGSRKEFVNFSRKVNVSGKLLEQTAMIVVTEYANAVIKQELLPYNIYPKPDWPPEDGENRFCGASK